MKYKYRLDKKWARILIYIRSLCWRKKRTDILNFQKCKSIALIYPHLIGDIVMVTPFLRMLRQVAPQAKITFIGAGWAKQILDSQNLVDEFICFQNPRAMLGIHAILKNHKDVWQTLQAARKQSFDIVVEPFGFVGATIFASFLKANVYIGVDFSNLAKLQTYTVPYDVNAHLVDDLMRLFVHSGYELSTTDYYPKLVLSAEQINTAQNFIKENALWGKTIIGIHPGASVPSRRWKGIPQTINLLCQNRSDTVICLFCGPTDETFVQNIIAHIDEKFKQKILVVKRPLVEYIAILSICSHVICNDSSCGHISAALRVPVTVLFAHGDPRFIAPRGSCTINIVSRDFPCKPCLLGPCSYNYRCFAWITPEIVFKTVQNTLEKGVNL